jgi:carboxylesterase type B
MRASLTPGSWQVVVVSLNYRLGAFGFLVTDTLRGNFGLQDQRAAMQVWIEGTHSFRLALLLSCTVWQWVQRNIAVFGACFILVVI